MNGGFKNFRRVAAGNSATPELAVGTVAMAGMVALAFGAGAVQAKVPFFNASCPGNLDIHGDDGGPVFINGKEGKLKVFNADYFEARHGKVTISVAINPDGSPLVSYTGPGGANGICTVK